MGFGVIAGELDVPAYIDLKKGVTKPAAKNFLQQQLHFDQFISIFNEQRPHQGLNMKYPAELYRPSEGAYEGLPEFEYPFPDRAITVTQCGRICLGQQKIYFSQSLAGQRSASSRSLSRIG